MRYAAILLAAGVSRRFGSDKRLASVDGEPMLLASLSRLRAAIADIPDADVQVVVRARDAVVTPVLVGAAGHDSHMLVQAPESPLGMGVSIATGLDALLRRGCAPDAVAICLADMPFVQPDTIKRLLCASAPGTISVPLFEGRRGHPVVFGSDFFPQLLKLRGSGGAAEILRAHPRLVREYPVADAGVLRDIDRPQDLVAAAPNSGDSQTPVEPGPG